jgi:hypothetical protein
VWQSGKVAKSPRKSLVFQVFFVFSILPTAYAIWQSGKRVLRGFSGQARLILLRGLPMILLRGLPADRQGCANENR